jgi:hypothetical protein
VEEPLASMSSTPKLRHDPPEVSGYRLHIREAIPINQLTKWTLLMVIPAGFVFTIGGLLILRPDELVVSITIWTALLTVAVLLIAVPVLHEAVHGAVALFVGGRPFFGVGRGYAYTSFREPISPRQYLTVTVAPLVVLSIATFVGFLVVPDWFFYLAVFGAGNAAGAVGDLWILARVRHLPNDALVYDLADGYAAFVPQTAEHPGQRQ